MKNDVDRILKQALSPEEEPDIRLNQNIIYRAEEMTHMAKKRYRKVPAAILAACFTLAAGSAAVLAAAKYLTPGELAEEFADQKLMEAFQGEDAVLVGETQEYGGYRVTLLGAVSGRNISEYLTEDEQGRLEDDRFYAAVAIERADGTPMPSTSDDAYGEEEFYVSPYIKGLEPWNYGIMNMGGGYSAFVRDGIQYRMLDMDNIEMFADRGIYIGVSDGTFYDMDAYQYDETTGEITRNESYDRLNALFVLPLDPAKGDPAAAEAFLKSLEEENSSEEPAEMDEAELEVEEWMEAFEAALQTGEIEDMAEVIESTVQICQPDAEGNYEYSYDLGDKGSGSGVAFGSELFPDHKPGSMGVCGYSYSENGLEDLEVDVCTLNEDGTATFGVYRPKMD